MSGKADPHKEFQSPLLRGQQSKVRAIKKVQRICWCDAIQAAMDISLLQGYVSVAHISFSTESLFRALYTIDYNFSNHNIKY